MHSPFRRTVVVGAGIVACALLFSLSVAPSLSLRGVPGPLVLMAEAPLRAFLWTGVSFALATVVACAVGRLINAVVAMFVLGCGVGLLAMRSGTVLDFAFGDGSLVRAALESALWCAAVAASSVAVFRVSGPLPDAVHMDDPKVDGPLGTKGIAALSCGALVLVGVFFIAVTPAKGQALGAVIVGSMVAGLAARLVSPKTPPVLFFAAPILFGALGQLIAHFLAKDSVPIDHRFVLHTLSRFAYPMPVDYAAGSLIGVSLGVGWARSFIKTEPVRA